MDALRAALAQIPDEVLFVLGIIAMITLLVIAASSLWGMYLAYKLGRWHGEQATVALLRKDIKWRKS